MTTIRVIRATSTSPPATPLTAHVFRWVDGRVSCVESLPVIGITTEVVEYWERRSAGGGARCVDLARGGMSEKALTEDGYTLADRLTEHDYLLPSGDYGAPETVAELQSFGRLTVVVLPAGETPTPKLVESLERTLRPTPAPTT